MLLLKNGQIPLHCKKKDLELPSYLKDWVLSCYNSYKLFKEVFYSSKYQLFVYENFYPSVTVEQATIAMDDSDIQTLIAKEWVNLCNKKEG